MPLRTGRTRLARGDTRRQKPSRMRGLLLLTDVAGGDVPDPSTEKLRHLSATRP